MVCRTLKLKKHTMQSIFNVSRWQVVVGGDSVEMPPFDILENPSFFHVSPAGENALTDCTATWNISIFMQGTQRVRLKMQFLAHGTARENSMISDTAEVNSTYSLTMSASDDRGIRMCYLKYAHFYGKNRVLLKMQFLTHMMTELEKILWFLTLLNSIAQTR